jgi:hypothetical protein
MKIGQEVICVDDSIKTGELFSVGIHYQNWIKKGSKYTVRAILDNKDIVTGILLEEVKNTPIYIKLIDEIQEPAFRPDRFRELQEPDKIAVSCTEEELLNLEL